MRIHLSLPPSSVAKLAVTTANDPPLLQIGKDLIMIELQGSLGFEGNPVGKVIGVLGFERMDKPTLHLGPHHLLHGKIVNLPKPLAIIRRKVAPAMRASTAEKPIDPDGSRKRAVGPTRTGDKVEKTSAVDTEEDDLDEDDLDLGETQDLRRRIDKDPLPSSTPPGPVASPLTFHNGLPTPTPTRPKPSSSALPAHLRTHITPLRLGSRSTGTSASHLSPGDHPMSSSPIPMPYQARDYSSDLSSPVRGGNLISDSDSDGEAAGQANGSGARSARGFALGGRKRKRLEVYADDMRKRADGREAKTERTKEYEVVGVVRRKVVFALRPEPIVTATVLPE